MDLTRKKQVVKWQTSPVSVFKLRHVLIHFFGTSRSRLKSWRLNTSSWEFGKMEHLSLVSVLKIECLLSSRSESLGKWNVSVLWLNVLWTSLVCSTCKRPQQTIISRLQETGGIVPMHCVFSLTMKLARCRCRRWWSAAAPPRVWNSLSTQLRESDVTLGQFWRALKTHLYAHWQLQHRVTSVFCALHINWLTYLLYKYSIVLHLMISACMCPAIIMYKYFYVDAPLVTTNDSRNN